MHLQLPLSRKSAGYFRYSLFAGAVIMIIYLLARNSLVIRSGLNVLDSVSASLGPIYQPSDVDAFATSSSFGPEDRHPISKLISDARSTFRELISGQSKTLKDAATAYRKRRGRHPPPGFDLWYQFARDNHALVVESFFDQIYHDIQPFWGADPAVLRKNAVSLLNTDGRDGISIRNHTITWHNDHFWFPRWADLINTIVHLLPDVDIPLNAEDVPRVVVPWEDVDALVGKAALTAKLTPVSKVVSEFQSLPPLKLDPDSDVPWEYGTPYQPYWPIVRRGCAPSSLARNAPLQKSFSEAPVINGSNAAAHLYNGYVSNYTLSVDLCHQPDLQGLEGIFIQPYVIRTTNVLVPMFGGSKLSVNNEILIPPPFSYDPKDDFQGGSGAKSAWESKGDKVFWRGIATGGRNTAENWRGFQRHRFLAMNNATTLISLETSEEKPQNFALPERQYNVQAHADRRLGEWVGEWAETSTVDLACSSPQPDRTCEYTNTHFRVDAYTPMSEQFKIAKYMPDIDGNSHSGRYLAFLRSTSLPIKATVWREWHDSRLVAWKHFVPMDNRFIDYYGIMEYFLGYEGRGGHDRAAKTIAQNGKEWAEKVLRKEDMQIYMLRLLLEYGRILDDRREHMGWAEDLKRKPFSERV